MEHAEKTMAVNNNNRLLPVQPLVASLDDGHKTFSAEEVLEAPFIYTVCALEARLAFHRQSTTLEKLRHCCVLFGYGSGATSPGLFDGGRSSRVNSGVKN